MKKRPSWEVRHEWPALFIEAQLYSEFHRITKQNLLFSYFAALDKYTPQLLKLYKKRKTGRFGEKMEDVLMAYEEQPRSLIHNLQPFCLLQQQLSTVGPSCWRLGRVSTCEAFPRLDFIPPEIQRTTEAFMNPLLPRRRRRGIINKSGARGEAACVLGYKLTLCTDRALPSLFLTTPGDSSTKWDEMKLRIVSAKIDSCVAIVSKETWLDNNIPDAAVELAGRSLFSGRTGLQPQRNTEVELHTWAMSDHISVNLIPAYKPLICRTRPTTRTVQVWTEEACLQHYRTALSALTGKCSRRDTDLDGYTSSVLSYLKFCTDAVLPTKTIKVFPNQKPWLDSTVKLLLKACNAAYRSGDKLAYSIARKELK
ncbi:hypothetical protein L3Q82_008295 [Scortum barcoo]|uniref:Uncharacterized protein n=1 Tax=Scortum barcoo TaxID=214431 RepID=A0ACB8WIE7_9TELE|nr:hypothetical protein L3Q82_008295 [Scortum barcoo]